VTPALARLLLAVAGLFVCFRGYSAFRFGLGVTAFLVGAYAAGTRYALLPPDPPWLAPVIVAAAGFILAFLVLAIKFTIRRQRPQGEWGAIYRNTDPHSFPSGHAARAFMLAVLALTLGPAWFGALVVIWAPLVSLARVSMGVHYLSDVAAGMVVGVLAGMVLVWISPVLIGLLPFIF